MFKAREELAVLPAFGRAAAPALLTRDLVVSRQNLLDRFDIATDLSVEVGSARWWRGVALLVVASVAAAASWPGFAPLRMAPSTMMSEAEQRELRSISTAPIALGADSGRHMAPESSTRWLADTPVQSELSLHAAVGPDGDIAATLLRAGAGREEAVRARALLEGALDSRGVAPGTQVDIRLGMPASIDSHRPIISAALRARFDLALSIERSPGGTLVLRRTDITVDETPLRIRGVVGNGLYRSARAAGAAPDIVQAFLEQVGRHVDLDEGLLPTDTFDIIVQHRRAASGEVEAGKLLYAGIDRDQRPHVQLMRWGDQFYEAGGASEQSDALTAPVPGRLTSHFGMRRHPILGYVRMHAGLDFAAAYGTPIVTVTDGRVSGAGSMGGCGSAVSLSHGGGLQTRYCHMSRVAVVEGQAVMRGQVIGFVGTSGLSTGSHLHYEMRRDGVPVDPAQVTFVSRAQLSGAEMARFRQALAVLKDVRSGGGTPSHSVALGARYTGGREIDRLGSARRPL